MASGSSAYLQRCLGALSNCRVSFYQSQVLLVWAVVAITTAASICIALAKCVSPRGFGRSSSIIRDQCTICIVLVYSYNRGRN